MVFRRMISEETDETDETDETQNNNINIKKK